MITHSGRPVLVLPPGVLGPCAWAASWWPGMAGAKRRALQLALPLLRLAERVDIAVFEPASGPQALADAVLADPRALLGLRRHHGRAGRAWPGPAPHAQPQK
ncbi:hypothetical protein LP420_05565 [Massilia sp. B-10]|nr:hypothetical protein LP420_05565 [Massilia sp. B-10]